MKELRRRTALYRAGLRDSASLLIALVVLSAAGALLTLVPTVRESGYWTNVASAPPFALLVLLTGEIPLSIRASAARCRADRESIRRAASAVLDLLLLLRLDKGEDLPEDINEPAESGADPDETDDRQAWNPFLNEYYSDPSAVRIGPPPTPLAMDPATYSGYLRILAGKPPVLDSVPSAPSGLSRVESLVIFDRLRESLTDLAASARRLEGEPAGLLRGPVDGGLRSVADAASWFLWDLSGDRTSDQILARSERLREVILALIRDVDADLPEWALRRLVESPLED